MTVNNKIDSYTSDQQADDLPETQNKSTDTHTIKDDQLWDEIGFHKPIAGFWYNITYTLVAIILSAVLTGYFLNFFYPFPESFGYKDVAFGYFTLMFSLFDIGTASVMSRFIPEVNIKDPEKMLHYIQYFIWYQMITGLIQTTAVSIYAIFYATQSNVAYTVWIMLIASTTQYPGFLGVFRSTLDSLQQYNKVRTLNFLTGTLFQRLTELGFVYLGRLYGEAHPTVGPILGIAIGASIGLYVDDFFATLLSASYFSKIMKQYGISTGRCFRIEFTWAEIKPVLIFSLKVSIPSIITGPLGYYQFLLKVDFIPQYTTISILAYIGGSIADIMIWFGTAGIGSLVAESYLNNKPRLTQYYIGQINRFHFLIIGFFVPLIITVYLVMPAVWEGMKLYSYMAGTAFILPRLVVLSFNNLFGVPGSVMTGANKPNFGVITGIISSFLSTGLFYLYMVYWGLPRQLNLEGIAWILEAGLLPISLVFALMGYWYVHTRIVKLKIPGKQILLGIVVPSVITYFLLRTVKNAVFDSVYASWGIFPAIFITVPLLFLGLVFGYFGLTAILGGWDDFNLGEFKKAAIMSGPSKFIVMPLYKLIAWACEKSPLHGKFAMESEQVIEDARDLLRIKRKNRELLKEKMS